MVKKLLCFACAIALGTGLWFTGNRPKFSQITGDYTVYLGSYSSSATIKRADGICYYKYFDKTGESVTFGGVADKDAIFADYSAVEVFSETTDYGVCFYGYTDKIPYYTLIRGEKINLHIFVGETRSTVGTPVIYGSF